MPGLGKDASGSVDQPKKELALKFGHTVVITTQEQLNLPNSIAALGFPPAHLSSRGLLMTNPGHVDPGYAGQMQFTVINVGKEDITLRAGDPILTLLFFRLNGSARAGYAERNGLTKPLPGPTQSEVNALSLDFLDVSNRADIAVTKAIKNAEFRAKLWGAAIPVFTTILVALTIGISSLWQPLNQLKSDVDRIEKVLDLKEMKSRLDKFEDLDKLQKRIDTLEDKLKNKPEPKAGGVKT